MDPRRRDEGSEAVDELQRGQELRATAARTRFAGLVEQELGIPLLQPFQRERRAGAVAQQSLQSRPVGGLDA